MEGRGEESADFVREPSFSGRREGYVFKTGDQGTGYYKDSPPDPDKPYQPVAPQPAKTFVIKTNKPLLKVKGRTADLAKGGRKGAKPDMTDGKSFYLREMEKYQQTATDKDAGKGHSLVK